MTKLERLTSLEAYHVAVLLGCLKDRHWGPRISRNGHDSRAFCREGLRNDIATIRALRLARSFAVIEAAESSKWVNS